MTSGGGVLFFWEIGMQYRIFFAPKGGDYSRETIISNTAHWKSFPKYFVLLSHKIKNNHIQYTEHGL